MAHPRWPGYPTKTGNPHVDNASRRVNRDVWRQAQQLRFTTPRGRRRLKYLKTVEGGRYVTLTFAVMHQIITERAAEARR